jgi:transglutaminase/protease-like cytokinesis protein 3
MALSSSLLLSHEFQITENAFNTIRNVVNLGEATHNANALFPSLNPLLLHSTYRYIENGPDMSIHFMTCRSGFRFFLYKTDERIYQVVSNDDVTEIYRVLEENGEF